MLCKTSTIHFLSFPFVLFCSAAQVRSYMYESVSTAVRNIVNENDSEKLKSENINKSRLQLKVNFPEVNPAFDTYRLGTVLEMVRHSSAQMCLRRHCVTHMPVMPIFNLRIYLLNPATFPLVSPHSNPLSILYHPSLS